MEEKFDPIEFCKDKLPIYIFFIDNDYTFGYSRDIFEWLIVVDGKWVAVDKRHLTPIDRCTLKEVMEKYDFLYNEVLLSMTRVLIVPPEFYNLPYKSLLRNLDWINRVALGTYGRITKTKTKEK